MKKLILILLVLFVSLPQISFGGKGKKEVSKVKVFMSNRELTKDEIIDGNWVEICNNIHENTEVIDRIEITDNTNSWFNIVILKGGVSPVLETQEYFNVKGLPKNKIVITVYPWILSGDLEGDYLVKIQRESNSDHLLRMSEETPENEPEEIVNFLLHYRECGD